MPTPQAEVLYPKAMAILEELKKVEEEVNSTKDIISGELLIGASTIPGAYILPAMAARFKELYPGISFEISIADSQKIINDVVDHKLLVGIVGAKMPTKKVEYQSFIDDELILIASTNRDLPAKLTVEDLLEHPFILREEGSGTRKNIESLLAQKNIRSNQLNTAATLGSNTAIKEAVKANLGISIISRYAVQDELEQNIIKEIKIEGISTTKRSFFIVTAQRRTLPNHYQVFLNNILRSSRL